MAKKPGSSPSAMKSRAAKTAAALSKPAGAAAAAPTSAVNAPAAPRKRVGPLQFLREVRAEARKISWPSRKETWITSVMVLIMVVITAGFLQLIDLGLGSAMQQILKFATAG